MPISSINKDYDPNKPDAKPVYTSEDPLMPKPPRSRKLTLNAALKQRRERIIITKQKKE